MNVEQVQNKYPQVGMVWVQPWLNILGMVWAINWGNIISSGYYKEWSKIK